MIEHLIREYGLFAIFIGCALEGDTVAITGGVLTYQGLLLFWPVVLSATAGAIASDSATFWLARKFREHPRVLRAVSHPLSQRLANTLLSRPLLLACVFRFIPGGRTVAPVMLATATTLRGKTYAIATAISAAVWGLLMVSMGRELGEFLMEALGHFTRTDIILMVALTILSLFLLRAVWRYFRTDSTEL